MNVSQVGINLIKSFEGCELQAYQDAVGVWTIGYGHTGGVTSSQKITQAQADDLLKKDLQRFVDGLNALLKVSVNQNQFDALVSFSFNLGLGNADDLTSLINKGDFKGAADLFPKYCHAGGQVLQGLVTRRKAEQALFNKPVAEPSPLYHIVVKGETATGIANHFHTTLANLDKLNPSVKNWNLIYASQKLRVK